MQDVRIKYVPLSTLKRGSKHRREIKRKRIIRNTSGKLSKKSNGMQQSDNLALEKIKEALSNSKNDTEQKILEITLQLMGQYSFAKYQTYPRPSHPETSK